MSICVIDATTTTNNTTTTTTTTATTTTATTTMTTAITTRATTLHRHQHLCGKDHGSIPEILETLTRIWNEHWEVDNSEALPFSRLPRSHIACHIGVGSRGREVHFRTYSPRYTAAVFHNQKWARKRTTFCSRMMTRAALASIIYVCLTSEKRDLLRESAGMCEEACVVRAGVLTCTRLPVCVRASANSSFLDTSVNYLGIW